LPTIASLFTTTVSGRAEAMPMTDAQIINELLMILQHYAPTGKEQKMCSGDALDNAERWSL
jgi:hypothetical protein